VRLHGLQGSAPEWVLSAQLLARIHSCTLCVAQSARPELHRGIADLQALGELRSTPRALRHRLRGYEASRQWMCMCAARRSPVVVVVVVVAIVAAAVVVVRTQRPRRFVVCEPSVSKRVEHRTHRPRRRRRSLQTHREHDEHQA
jgi:hypothetical protein